MILFLNDWKKYPNAIVHEDTKSESWLFMADVYKAMGVSNYYWHLALLNPMLKHVNPFDPDLSTVLKAAIKVECEKNPFYFFREVARTKEGEPVNANRGNLAVWWLALNHTDYYLVQIRQTGKTNTDNQLDNYVLHIAGEGVNINKLTKDAALRAANIQDIKEIRDNLPDYLNPYDKGKDKNNTEELNCSARSNHLRIYVGQSSPGAAYKTGRGHTAEINKGDEGPFTENVGISLGSMIASGTTKRDLAKSRNGFYYSGFTTTAGKINTPSGQYMYKMMMDGFPWNEMLYDAVGPKDLARMVILNSPGKVNMVSITLSHKQLGYDDVWLKTKIKENRLSGEDADRDMFNRWTTGGLRSPLPVELNEAIHASERDPVFSDIAEEGYIIRWYVTRQHLEEVKHTRKILIGQDSSAAIGKDALTLIFIDSWTGEVLGASAVNETNVYTYIGYVVNLMLEEESYVIIPERRSTGTVLIDGLIIGLIQAGINPLTRIYNTIVDNDAWSDDENDVYRGSPAWWPTSVMDRVKRACGYATSGSGQHSRTNLYGNTLVRAAELGCEYVNDKRLISEINGLVERNGRIDHAVAGHDDMVIGWLLPFWMLLFSRNLSAYGISNALCEAVEWSADNVGRELTNKEIFESELVKEYRAEFDHYMTRLEKCTCEYTASAIERILRRLYEKIGASSAQVGTIDDLISRAKERALDK